MKNLNFLVLIAFLTIVFGCSNDDDKVYTEAFVIGYQPCTDITVEDDMGEAPGYFLVTTDTKDTLFTAFFPEGILKFPVDCFNNHEDGDCSIAFPKKYDGAFKIKMKYSIVPKEDNVYFICDAMRLWCTGFTGEYKQIIIESIEK